MTVTPDIVETMCLRKRRYNSISSAEKWRKNLQRKRRNRNLDLRAYHCPICRCWHLTSKPFLES